MAFIERNNVVQQVSSTASDPTLRYTVLPGTPERGSHRVHLQGSNCRWKIPTIFRISIEDQKLGSGTKGKRLAQLLDDPTTRRMLCDVNVQDASPIMADDEEAVEHAERDRWHSEEIHGRNRFPMVSKEGQPALGRVRISRCSFHPTGDGYLGKIKTEHEEFPMYPRCSPGRVVSDHFKDQIPNLLRRRSSSNLHPDSEDQPPVDTKTIPVPADDGFGRNDEEGFLPRRPDPPSDYPEELIEEGETRARMSTFQHSELLPEHEILQNKIPTATEEAS